MQIEWRKRAYAARGVSLNKATPNSGNAFLEPRAHTSISLPPDLETTLVAAAKTVLLLSSVPLTRYAGVNAFLLIHLLLSLIIYH